MPTFKRFGGFRLDMRSRDHAPPHFHMIGPDFHALVEIRTLQVIEGTYTRKALTEVLDWAADHRDELLAE